MGGGGAESSRLTASQSTPVSLPSALTELGGDTTGGRANGGVNGGDGNGDARAQRETAAARGWTWQETVKNFTEGLLGGYLMHTDFD